MASKVYFIDFRTHTGHSMLRKVERLLKAAGMEQIDFKDKFTAIKIHFGEPGNLAYIRPNYVNAIVKVLRELGAKVYLTDANTLYSGGRSNAVDHHRSASANGFNLLQVDAPVIIADGIKGTEYREMPVVGGETCTHAKIGSAVADADIVLSISHFKGHEQAGFGGALKNLGMGAAAVPGKKFLHCDSKPDVDMDKCVGCGICAKNCAHDAIHVADRKAVIDYEKCLGCGQCIAVCPNRAVDAVQDVSPENMNIRIAEYTKAILDGKPNFHISFIMDVSPECDCWGSNDAALVPNIGVAASFDPVALDQACADLVIAAPKIETSAAGDLMKEHHHHHGEDVDVFTLVHPNSNWRIGLAHAEKIGVGSREYELIRL